MKDLLGNEIKLLSYVYVPDNNHHGLVTEFIKDGDEDYFRISDSTIYSGKDVVVTRLPDYKLISAYKDVLHKLIGKDSYSIDTKDYYPTSVLTSKHGTEISYKEVVSIYLHFDDKYPITNFLTVFVKDDNGTVPVEFYNLHPDDREKILLYVISYVNNTSNHSIVNSRPGYIKIAVDYRYACFLVPKSVIVRIAQQNWDQFFIYKRIYDNPSQYFYERVAVSSLNLSEDYDGSEIFLNKNLGSIVDAEVIDNEIKPVEKDYLGDYIKKGVIFYIENYEPSTRCCPELIKAIESLIKDGVELDGIGVIEIPSMYENSFEICSNEGTGEFIEAKGHRWVINIIDKTTINVF